VPSAWHQTISLSPSLSYSYGVCYRVQRCGQKQEWLTDIGTLPSVETWLDLTWLRLAWLGLAWLGLAWLGLAWTPFTLHTYPPMKMEHTQCSETLEFKLQTPVNHPQEIARQNKCYIAVGIKHGAILQCETEVYSKRSRSHKNWSFWEKETLADRGHWEVKCRVLCAEKRHHYFVRHTDCSYSDWCDRVSLGNASHCRIILHNSKLC
jgi:hypothetical protein